MMFCRGGFGPLVFCLLIFLVSDTAIAQRDSRLWYFGLGAGLDFNYEPPRAIESAIETLEGCANAFNPDGKLLFYTNGETVWNSNHKIMENGEGLAGHVSSAQSSLVIPFPGDSTRYYLFTTDNEGYMDTPVIGLSYSVIDLKYNHGLGKVTQKNINLLPKCYERLTGVKHCNERDYWVIVKSNRSFHTYKVTPNGIDSAIVTTIGKEEISNYKRDKTHIGYLEVSPDRTKLALVARGEEEVQLFRFDPGVGTITSPLLVSLGGSGAYCASFSGNSNVLYISTHHILFQSSVAVWDSDVIEKSLLGLDTIGNWGEFFGLQLGPDNKLYVLNYTPWLTRIDDPNALGTACHLVDSVVRSEGFYPLGFPNFIDAIGTPSKCSPPIAAMSAIDTICEAECIELMDRSKGDVPWVSWRVVKHEETVETSQERSFEYCGALPGRYDIELISSNSGGADTAYRSVYVKPSLSSDNIVLQLDHQRAYPGDTVTYSLASDQLTGLPNGTFLRLELEFDTTVLIPVGVEKINGRVPLEISSPDTVKVRFVTRMGSSDSSPVTIKNLHWVNACPMIVKTIDGGVKLNVKREGGGFAQIDKRSSIVPFPNPNFGSVQVMIDLAREGKTGLHIADAAGRIVRRIDKQLILGKNWLDLRLDELSAGSYTITLKTEHEYETESFILLR